MPFLKFKYTSLILALLMSFVFAPNVFAQENIEVDRSEDAQQKVEDAESKTDAEIEEQKERQVPRSIADRAPDGIEEEIFQTEAIKKSIFEDDPLDIFIQPWRRINRKLSEARSAFLFMLPALTSLLLFIFIPIIFYGFILYVHFHDL